MCERNADPEGLCERNAEPDEMCEINAQPEEMCERNAELGAILRALDTVLGVIWAALGALGAILWAQALVTGTRIAPNGCLGRLKGTCGNRSGEVRDKPVEASLAT